MWVRYAFRVTNGALVVVHWTPALPHPASAAPVTMAPRTCARSLAEVALVAGMVSNVALPTGHPFSALEISKAKGDGFRPRPGMSPVKSAGSTNREFAMANPFVNLRTSRGLPAGFLKLSPHEQA
ncbi:hypothetical protein CL620_06110 [archaeon]|nr:hypothetical protein [archaeon]